MNKTPFLLLGILLFYAFSIYIGIGANNETMNSDSESGIESNNYVGALDGFAGGMCQQAPHLVNPSFVNI